VALILPTGTYRAEDFVAAAGAVGAEVVVVSDGAQAMAEAMGDRALEADLCDPEAAAAAIVDLARRLPLDAVVGVDDQGVEAAARAAARLGLRHGEPAAVAITRDKAAMRRALAGAGVPQPDFEVVEAGEDPEAAVARLGPPVVVKPSGLSASRGVIRVDSVSGAAAVAERVRAIAAAAGQVGAALVVERFLDGPEVAVEGLLDRGSLRTLAVFDKPDPLDGPYFEETIYVTPSRHPPGLVEAAVGVVAAAAAAIGLAEGPVHAEVRLTAAGPRMVEVAARSIGGHCSRILRFGAGTSLEELILAHALGRPIDGAAGSSASRATGVMMLPIPASGTLRAVGGVEEARAVPGMDGLEISIPLGRPVVALPEGDRYLGFLFASGQDPAFVEEALRRAHQALAVVIEAAPGR